MLIKTQIPRRAFSCASRGCPLQPGMTYVAYLLDENGEYKRIDYCLNCWEQEKREGPHWRGKIPCKEEKEVPEKLLALFRRLEDHKKIYLLALYLERKRLAILQSDFCEIVKTGELFPIKKMQFSLEDEKTLLEEMAALLQ